ncbi:1-aminocyclopropane-1-carboxylate deaminase/D-cysteine desulfhydrase [Mesonia maritima]|uniref:1-aminocyclopropane-1-carboxylate deaminase n=1 Tax=Mesonia maritima TaxID=1793873 RepID=A0ABU1K8D8_9FLAO|nr:pyridoxal-phosphate dependent enzyme [Mesonia maritima]MDR6301879.1 1-aminocyclopropane-1-carboxylate deaminase [Mesonia maritima]
MNNFLEYHNDPINQFLLKDEKTGIELWLKREDLLHPFVSGNKYRKLKYNLIEARKNGYQKILTFGGAFSNHIAATAFAAKEVGLESVGVIRGEELGKNIEKILQENSTLAFANEQNMNLHFISRSDYREKDSVKIQHKLEEKFGLFYRIPEGGTNGLAVKGCEEIISDTEKDFDVICSSVGTGGTISGLVNASFPHQKIIGFLALKGDFLAEEIKKFSKKNNWELILDYHFGGYAKVDDSLIQFINKFTENYAVQLDPVYTGKLLFGIIDLIKAGRFKENTRILAIHTGGLQGISGMNKKLAKKNMPLLKTMV